MDFSYDFTEMDDHLLVKTTGAPESPEEFFNYIKSSIIRAMNSGLSRVVFDETASPLKFKVYDAVLMSDQLEREGLQTLGIRASIICNSHDLEACKYFETSLRNRSFNVMMFDDIDEGRNWLLK